MRHYICAGFDISDRYIKWDSKNNAGGLGQGNGGASVSCHSHMLPLEKAYETETGHGVEYTNPDKTRRLFQWLVDFVDGNSLMLKMKNLGYESAADPLLAATIQCMEIWQRLVHITGGKLELEKKQLFTNGLETRRGHGKTMYH